MIQEHQHILLIRDDKYLRNQVQMSGKQLQLLSSRGMDDPATPSQASRNPTQGLDSKQCLSEKAQLQQRGTGQRKEPLVPLGGFLQQRGRFLQQGQHSAQEGSPAPPAGFWVCSQGEQLRNPHSKDNQEPQSSDHQNNSLVKDRNERTKE